MTEEKIELIVGQNPKVETVADEVYQKFLTRFQEQVKGDLDKYRELRRLSEEEAKRRFVS